MRQGHNSEATGGIQKEAKDDKERPEEAAHHHGLDKVASREDSRDVGYGGLETNNLINKGSGVEKCSAGTEKRQATNSRAAQPLANPCAAQSLDLTPPARAPPQHRQDRSRQK